MTRMLVYRIAVMCRDACRAHGEKKLKHGAYAA